ncbi:MAG: phage holin family protein [Planctomycetota bacterium]
MEQEIQRRTNGRVTLSPEISTAAGLLAHDVPNLVREGVTLAKLEAKKTARDVGVRAGILAASGYLALVGLFFVFTGLAFLISEMSGRAWLGPLVVGGGLVAIAGVAIPVTLKAGSTKTKPA